MTAKGILSMEVTDTVKMTLRLSEQLHEKLRWLAYRDKKSQQILLIEIIEKALADVEPPEDDQT